MSSRDTPNAIGFAEKVIELLDEGRYTSTYKFAVLLALIDLCIEGTEASGSPPQMVTTRQLAEKVVQLYWSHTVPFAGQRPPLVLQQNTGGQAEIVSTIRRFREQHAPDSSVPHWESRLSSPGEYNRLVRRVEWKLVQMPLPRLQTTGNAQRRFIYEINWDDAISRGAVAAYQAGEPRTFDNRVLLQHSVGEYFVQLSGLLRPLIQRQWAAKIAHVNHLEESQLEIFLFGSIRMATARVRAGLWEIQDKRCFYCGARICDPTGGEVDHFIPWSRYPDDALDNFVVADRRCNGQKSSSLAAADHLRRWSDRFAAGSNTDAEFQKLATETRWNRQPVRTLSVARAIYPRLPSDARLWLRGNEFVPPDHGIITDTLRTPHDGSEV